LFVARHGIPVTLLEAKRIAQVRMRLCEHGSRRQGLPQRMFCLAKFFLPKLCKRAIDMYLSEIGPGREYFT